MNQKLVRITSADGIEQPGILYFPIESTDKIVVHVHGLNGNFYENRFIDYLAKAYVNKGYAFLTFNNRGRDFIRELLMGEKSTIIGGCYEKFKDCLFDLDGIINWINASSFKDIVLEGHSYGCNKILYYYSKRKLDNISKLILLSPCDLPTLTRKLLTKEIYEKTKNDSKKFVALNKENELIDFSIMANGKISAGTFYSDFIQNGANDFLKYSDNFNKKNTILNKVTIPTLIVLGDKDDYCLTESMDKIKSYFQFHIRNCYIEVIKDANHSFDGNIIELVSCINKYF